MISNKRKLIVLCDLDAIVANLLGPWLRFYNEKYGDNLTVEQITEFDIHKFVKKECGQKVYEFIDTGVAYTQLEPLPGAVEGIKTLEQLGHEVIIVSAGAKNLATAGHKLEWCKKVLGFSRKKCMIAHRKELVRGDVFIDDSPKNIIAYRNAWPGTPILTIAYPYNATVDSICTRYPSHSDTVSAWESMVEAIEQIAHLPVAA